MLSNIDKARLATELCGLEKVETGPEYLDDTPRDFFYTLNGDYHCGGPATFDPENNWNHMRLVLEGLVKKTMEKFTAYSKDKACRIILHQLATLPEMPEDNWLGSLVCTAGLDVLNQKGAKP